ncbi:hypothetical protein Avbf_13755 [Armadillidium vulgare]|nr:hypothetical protein Avbf_13755 [Armadillidium vulgare]
MFISTYSSDLSLPIIYISKFMIDFYVYFLRIQSILESDVMRRNAFDTAKIQKRNFSNRIYLNHFMTFLTDEYL